MSGKTKTTIEETPMGIRDVFLSQGAEIAASNPRGSNDIVASSEAPSENATTASAVGAEKTNPDTPDPMLPSEEEKLKECESHIAAFAISFVDAGTALAVIRDGKLYRARHGTFDDYCRDRWEFSPQRAGQIVKAAEVAKALAEHASTQSLPQPGNEGQVRPLTRLADLEERAAVWELAVEMAGGKRVTAELVIKAIAELSLKTGAKTAIVQPSRVIGQVEQFAESLERKLGKSPPHTWTPDQRKKLLGGLIRLTAVVERAKAGVSSFSESPPAIAVPTAV